MRKKPLLTLSPLLLLALLAACNLPAGDATATPGLNATQSYQTAVARVTELFLQTASPAGSASPTTPAGTATPTDTPAAGTPSATPAPPTALPTSTPIPCDFATAGNPIDVTIPDDTQIVAGTTFTKTWRLVNSGTCTWNSNYAVVYSSGDKLGAPDSKNLPGTVPPNGTLDISVVMVAPAAPGTYQGNWKLRNASGLLFGLNGNDEFWVRIKVISPTPSATPTPTASPTATSAPTATPTPGIAAQGSVNLTVGAILNLDNLFLGGAAGNDLSYITDVSDNHILNPLNGAQFGVFGASQPSLNQCKNASLGGAGITVENNPVGTYICYRTDENRYGWMQIAAFNSGDGALTLSALTWAGGQ
jgi:hypothetical protein